MKTRIKFSLLFVFFSIIMMQEKAGGQLQNPCTTGGQTCYFAVEINGILCGYSHDTYCNVIAENRTLRKEDSNVYIKMKVLGATMDGGFKYSSLINRSSGRAEVLDISIINGESVARFITKISGDTAYFSSPTSGFSKTLIIDDDVIAGSLFWYSHLVNDMIKKDVQEKKYKVYDPIKGELVDKLYIKKKTEKIQLSDTTYNAVVFEETDLSTAINTTLWVLPEDGYNVRTLVAGRNIYLSDKSVTSKIAVADLDKELFYSVGVIIPEPMNLTNMKVRARINSFGEELTAESLNTPGQKFTGTVKGSLIDGIFETVQIRYSGENAPAFPPDFKSSSGLEKYLSNEIMIESDEPEIISLARSLTREASNSWEAAVILSKWVSVNIEGVLPGGISAINTLRTGGAECGGHSRLLAALCRAVGIPARVVVGCMFTNYNSGGFGQHAWTEVYMGKSGWIPVDATIYEADYIDAGHLRLGEKASFRPVAMELIDFQTGQLSPNSLVTKSHPPEVGQFTNIDHYRTFNIVYENDALAFKLPGRPALELQPPDQRGILYPKLTREIGLKPDYTGSEVDKVNMYQHFTLVKMPVADTFKITAPLEYRAYPGNYRYPPARLSLDVRFAGKELTTQDPLGRSKERISYSFNGSEWTDKSGNYELVFNEDASKNITSMSLTVRLEFVRGAFATDIVEELVKKDGVDTGMRKYDELKDIENSGYLFSDQVLHQIGHRLLAAGKIDEAVTVFTKNAEEYPDSFMAIDAAAEAFLKKGDKARALKYFRAAVKLNPQYEYGKEKISELSNN
jgi:hypothetical protein